MGGGNDDCMDFDCDVYLLEVWPSTWCGVMDGRRRMSCKGVFRWISSGVLALARALAHHCGRPQHGGNVRSHDLPCYDITTVLRRVFTYDMTYVRIQARRADKLPQKKDIRSTSRGMVDQRVSFLSCQGDHYIPTHFQNYTATLIELS